MEILYILGNLSVQVVVEFKECFLTSEFKTLYLLQIR